MHATSGSTIGALYTSLGCEAQDPPHPIFKRANGPIYAALLGAPDRTGRWPSAVFRSAFLGLAAQAGI